MRLHALGCYGGEAPGCHHTSLLVNGHLLLDAGSVTAVLPLDAWSTTPVIRQLKRHVFNGSIWPDFTKIPSGRPILSFHEIRKGQPTRGSASTKS